MSSLLFSHRKGSQLSIMVLSSGEGRSHGLGFGGFLRVLGLTHTRCLLGLSRSLFLVSLLHPKNCLGCGSEGEPKRSRPELPLMGQLKSSRGHRCLPLPGAPQACGVNGVFSTYLQLQRT